MILNALMFVLGAWYVQQMAHLPSISWLTAIFFGALLICVSQLFPRFNFKFSKILRKIILALASFLFGVVWASSFALWRMSDELPHQWEQKTIAIVGVVASVPEVTERGVRFRFDV